MKYSTRLVKLDSLSCSNSFCLVLVSVLILAKDRGVHGEQAFGTRKPTYSGYVKLKSYVFTIHLGEGDSDLQTFSSLVGLMLVLVS